MKKKKNGLSENLISFDEDFDFKNQRTPPEAKELEEKVLGAILIDNLAYEQATNFLKPEYFYSAKNGIIFQAMISLYGKSEPIDILTLKIELERMKKLNDVGGQDYIVNLTSNISTSANIDYYSRIIYEKYVLRQLIHISANIVDKSFDTSTNPFQLIGEAESHLLDISNALSKKQAVDIKIAIQEIFEELGDKRSHKTGPTGVPTGYYKLDDLTGGLQKSELIIIAGRPSHGKTAFAMNIARNAAVDAKKSVGIFSLEMSTRELLVRMISSEARVNGKLLKANKCSEIDWNKIISTYSNLKVNMFIDDSSELTIHELRAKAKRMYLDHKIDLIIVDYLQLVRGSGTAERRDLEVAEVSKGLKALAKDLDIPVLACAQLNRGIEGRGSKEKRPQLADLRESGALEQDADVVIFVHRPVMNMKHDENNPEYIENKVKAEIIIGKQRNGPVDDLTLRFVDQFASFENPHKDPALDMAVIRSDDDFENNPF